MRLLITGVGRCGTKWFAQTLTEAGLPCSHEKHFTPVANGSCSDWRAEASWLAAPHTPRNGIYVVHLTRHPLDIVRSRTDKGTFERGGPWQKWAERFAPGMMFHQDPLMRAGIHYVQWSRLVVADEILKLENVTTEDVTRLARMIDPEARELSELPPKENATVKRSPRPTWGDLEGVPFFRETAERYGY